MEKQLSEKTEILNAICRNEKLTMMNCPRFLLRNVNGTEREYKFILKYHKINIHTHSQHIYLPTFGQLLIIRYCSRVLRHRLLKCYYFGDSEYQDKAPHLLDYISSPTFNRHQRIFRIECAGKHLICLLHHGNLRWLLIPASISLCLCIDGFLCWLVIFSGFSDIICINSSFFYVYRYTQHNHN